MHTGRVYLRNLLSRLAKALSVERQQLLLTVGRGVDLAPVEVGAILKQQKARLYRQAKSDIRQFKRLRK